jgi:hypothetical protein
MIQLTLAVVAEGHLGLAETNGVLALRDAIELLELSLVNALQRDWSEGKVAIGGREGPRPSVASAWRGSDIPGWGSKAQWP